MALGGKLLTEREKAALYYMVFGHVDDWRQVYKIADPTNDKGEVKYFDQYVSNWKNSDKVQAFIKRIQKEKDDNDAEQRNQGREQERNRSEDNERTEGNTTPQIKTNIDYSDPKNRQRLYNEVIARSKDDPKTQLDAAKMFEQIQKDDREAAKVQKQQRIYLPLTCYDCPLYNKRRKQTTK